MWNRELRWLACREGLLATSKPKFLKDFFLAQASIISILIWIVLLAFVLRRYKKPKTAKALFIVAVVLFYLFSTAWLPRYLAYCLEKQYPPLKDVSAVKGKGKVYIHLLGSGYQTDSRLPATEKLAMVAQGRFTAAMQLYNAIDSSILVGSADGPAGMPTQAMIVKDAALALGADSNRVMELNTPSSTKEEAEDLAKAVGPSATVIVVTDAMHMPRAMGFFKAAGFSPVAAPTNFRAINGSEGVKLKWWPSEENIYITNRLLHEYFASIKAMF
jgi:uncharacterized SAM-binding protein YcdF (DUF218 family)